MSLNGAERKRINQIARGRSAEPLRLLEGARAVRDALQGGHVAELWLRSDLPAGERALLERAARERDVPVGEGSPANFQRLTRTVSPQGVLALVYDTTRPLSEVLERAGRLLWLDGVQDPGNVGAMARVAVAFGAAGLLISRGGAHPLGLKALRASAGLALALPLTVQAPEVLAAALRVPERPVWLLERDGEDVFGLRTSPADLVLVVGSEGAGVGGEARTLASKVLGIPIAPAVESLNAAVAAGIALAALVRGSDRAP